MTFNDIFKSSFLESITEFSAVDTLIAMVAALVIGMFIFVVYEKTFNSVMYSTGFAMTLVGMTMVTTPGNSGGNVKCGAVSWYGRCTFHRAFPCGN